MKDPQTPAAVPELEAQAVEVEDELESARQKQKQAESDAQKGRLEKRIDALETKLEEIKSMLKELKEGKTNAAQTVEPESGTENAEEPEGETFLDTLGEL